MRGVEKTRSDYGFPVAIGQVFYLAAREFHPLKSTAFHGALFHQPLLLGQTPAYFGGALPASSRQVISLIFCSARSSRNCSLVKKS